MFNGDESNSGIRDLSISNALAHSQNAAHLGPGCVVFCNYCRCPWQGEVICIRPMTGQNEGIVATDAEYAAQQGDGRKTEDPY